MYNSSVFHTFCFKCRINDVTNQLDKELLAKALPIMSNLIFLKRQNFTKVKGTDALNLIERFRAGKNSTEYMKQDAEMRLQKLADFVENMRKFAEFLLQSAGCTEYATQTKYFK